jgi:cytochrome b
MIRAEVRVWDAFVRLFHWTLVGCFIANALLVDPESQPHRMLGYAVVGLVLARIVWGFAGSRHARFSDFPPSASAALSQAQDMVTGRRRVHAGHSPLGALMIYNLLAVMLAIGATGYMMTTLRFFGVEWVEELHEALVTWAELSVVAHVAAVIFESRRLQIDLARAMVTGTKSLPAQGE